VTVRAHEHDVLCKLRRSIGARALDMLMSSSESKRREAQVLTSFTRLLDSKNTPVVMAFLTHPVYQALLTEQELEIVRELSN
jgi:hypothetical protein